MKSYLSLTFLVVSVLLAVMLAMAKHADNAQLEVAASAMADCSNRLDTAQAQMVIREGTLLTLLTLSNTLTETSLEFSNRLTDAQSKLALQTDQITSLNRQVAVAAAENQTLGLSITDLTNQLATLTGRISQTEASLTRTNGDLVQLHKNYALLDNRLRRDVAERVVVERRFNNLAEVQAQAAKLWKYPTLWVTPESIYAGLDVEVKSSGSAHVITPD